MSKKIDERIPQQAGKGVLKDRPAITSPWDKMVSYRDACYFCARFNAVIGANLMQAYRILVPDYEKRSEVMCQATYDRMFAVYTTPGLGEHMIESQNSHPFCVGNFSGAISSDSGDERYLMYGRVNDFGTYRIEKELDACPWDIVGSELCRATMASTIGVQDGFRVSKNRPGPTLDLCMVEARGCGDRHCRVVGENREKFPMPKQPLWERFGPIATADQIKLSTEEYAIHDSEQFCEDCGYIYTSGTCLEEGDSGILPGNSQASSGSIYILPGIERFIEQGELKAEWVDYVIKCVCEAGGKSAFGDFYTKKGLVDWLGAPDYVKNDGRLMGGYLEVLFQCLSTPYEIEAFNKDEVIYLVDRSALGALGTAPRMVNAYMAFWYGAVRTLVGAEWFLWEEDSPEGKIRIKIAKKIDKFC